MDDTAIPEHELNESHNSVTNKDFFLQSENSNVSCNTDISLIVNDVKSEEPVAKRRPGRPPKKLTDSTFVENEQPTRVSTRKRKVPTVINYNEEDKGSWTNKDKIEFLKALEEVGPENLEALQSYLPHKTENDIQNKIRMWSNFARVELHKNIVSIKGKPNSPKNGTLNSVSKLDEWIQHFKELEEITPPRLYALSNIFLLIAEYGDFPEPKEFNGLDLRSMYRYLHCMLNGQPHYGMNQQTASTLNNCIKNVFTDFRHNKEYMDVLQSCLFNSNSTNPNMRTYSRLGRRKLSACTRISDIMKRRDMNPLNIKPSFLSPPPDLNKSNNESSEDSVIN